MKTKYFDVTDAGVSIKCKLYCGEGHSFPDLVISCHGFGGDKENSATLKLAETLLPVHKDAAVLAFDWPCHGKDIKPKLDLNDCLHYLEVILAYGKNVLGAQRLYSFATSFGGYLTLHRIHEKGNPFEKILLRCPAIYMYQLTAGSLTEQEQAELAKKKETLHGRERKIRITAKFLEQLRENDITTWDFSHLTENLLILHGTKDSSVSHDIVEAFADKNGIDFLSIVGGDHIFREPSKLREVLDYTMEHYFG